METLDLGSTPLFLRPGSGTVQDESKVSHMYKATGRRTAQLRDLILGTMNSSTLGAFLWGDPDPDQ